MARSHLLDHEPHLFYRSALVGSRHLHVTDDGKEIWNCQDTLPSLLISILRGPRPEPSLNFIVWVRVGTLGWHALKRAGWAVADHSIGSDFFERPLREDEF